MVSFLGGQCSIVRGSASCKCSVTHPPDAVLSHQALQAMYQVIAMRQMYY